MKKSKLGNALSKTIDEYLETRTVNGAWLIKDSDNSRSFRIFWMILLLLLFVFGANLMFQLWSNFYSYPVRHINDKNLPTSSVPFPGISICSPIVFKYNNAKEFVSTL